MPILCRMPCFAKRFCRKLKHSFLLKASLGIFALSLVGLVLGTFLTNHAVFQDLRRIESQYESFMVRKYVEELNEMLGQFNDIFESLYLEDFMGFTIENLLSDSLNPLSPTQKARIIVQRLQRINRIYPFISELILLDFEPEQNYTMTLNSSRDIRLDYIFSKDPLIEKLKNRKNRKIISSPFRPAYIFARSGKAIHPVLSIGLNIFDNRYYTPEKPSGSLIINIDPKIFADIARGLAPDFPGNLILYHRENGIILFDLQALWIGENLPGALTKGLRVSRSELVWDQLELIHLSDDRRVQVLYNKNRNLVIGITVIISLVLFGVFWGLSQMIYRRLNPLIHSMEQIAEGNFRVLTIDHHDEFSDAEVAFNKMGQILDDYINRVLKVELQYQKTKLKLLRQQLNPHFMYNTLQSIQMKALIHQNMEIGEMIHILGEIFRWSSKESVEVSLEEELYYLSRYVELQSHRFQNNLYLTLDVPVELKGAIVLKMIFQPLIENAVYHGLGRQKTDGRFYIRALRCDHTLLFWVHDNGTGFDSSQLNALKESLKQPEGYNEEHIGLLNLHQRIQTFYQVQRLGIRDIQSSPEGSCISLEIPFKSEKLRGKD